MTKSKRKTVNTIVFMLVFSIVVIAIYFIIRTQTSPLVKDSGASVTEAEKLLTKDIPNSYPASPREVLKLYSRIAKSYFNEDLEEKEIEALANQMQHLFDEELLANKSYEDYLIDLKVEITGYKKANRTMMNYVVEDSDAVVYWESEDKEYASIVASYTLKEGADYTKIFEEFILRKDKEDKWKILGWSLADKTELNAEE